MLRVYGGLPGYGKTTTMCNDLILAMEKGIHVAANFDMTLPIPLKEKFVSWSKLSETFEMKNCIIAIDELAAYADSRNWKNLPLPFLRKLQQHRKDSLHIWGTVQSPKRLDVAFRELVDEWVMMKKIAGSSFEKPSADTFEKKIGNKTVWGYFSATHYDNTEFDADTCVFEKKGLLLPFLTGERRIVKLTPKLARMFDTMHPIAPDMPNVVHVNHLEVNCPECGPLRARHTDDPEI